MGLRLCNAKNEDVYMCIGYSSFHFLRERIAKEIGIELMDMQGFCGEKPLSMKDRSSAIPWSKIHDNVKYFLKHSDCDGYISPKRCGVIYPRIVDITKKWDNSDIQKQYADKIIEVMKYCFQNNKRLLFR